MRILTDGLHKAFESRIRLGIMSALAVNDVLDFNSLKEYLDVTDGNLASHIKALEKEEFIGVEKSFVGKKPNTRYFMTKEGKKAFNDHLEALEKFIKSGKSI
ncbi:MAG: transcriptional regulator [Bacteroidales bacterium]|nr:transcriptional regulator [Bacteroidales bacterium]MDD4292967.1 transcriptional regulator [Bacteroidales bacterium]MDD4491932.1 transcriptional regulator [Bacteroidales bacterium]HNW48441.1 transcriptional regulator [Bacteroidales bacterium]HPS95727.1 transcriptional regulator [Bacteroidales bacterium]